MDAARGFGNSIEVMSHRKNAGVVLKTQLGQDLECPQRLPGDREGRGAKPYYSYPNRILYGLACLFHVFPEFGRGQGRNPTVPVAVARDLVPRLRDLPHQGRLALRYPTQNEKCGPTVVSVKQLKHTPGILTHP